MEIVLVFILMLLIGIFGSTFGSLIGLGGGIIFVPALIFLSPYLFEVPITTAEAAGTSLVVLVFTAASAVYSYHKQGKIDYRSALLFAISSGPGSIIGSMLTSSLDEGVFNFSFGCFMLLMALLLGIRDRMKPISIKWKYQRTYTDRSGDTHSFGYSMLPVLVIGAVVGLISGLFGIGGGSLLIPSMVLLFRYPPHVATATSMMVILIASILGSGTKISLGEVNWLALAALAPGAWIGGTLGSKIASRLSYKWLMRVIFIAFFAMAIRLIWQGISQML